jgi:hypothetical protein
MVNPEELAICKRRGHEPPGREDKWRRCRWCGVWLRTVSTIEEREDEPPEDEKSPSERLEEMARELGKKKGRNHNG